MSSKEVVESTRKWVESVVIELNLCPFAKRELMQDRVRFTVSEATTEEQLLAALQRELELLGSNAQIETTLLIHPEVLQDFYDYNQFLDFSDRLLVEMKLAGVFQIASFHPAYQFGGTEPDDAENFTNRSPYPMLHILREASLERAIAGYPDIDQVPIRNIEHMNSLGQSKLRSLFDASFARAEPADD